MSVANVQILYKRVELAVEQPRLYVFQFFEDLRNQIDIVYQMALDDSNEEMMLEQQAELREKVKEVESYCMERIVEAVKEDRDGEMRLTFGQIEADLKREDILKGELERMEGVLLDEMLQIEKELFQNRTMLFVKATDEDKEDEFHDSIASHLKCVSNKAKESGLFGVLICVGGYFIENGAFEKK